MNPEELRSLAGRVSLLDGQRPERLAEVHERIGFARRRRTIAASVGTAGVVLAVLAGVASYSMRDDAGPGPVKKPEPTAVDTRPLVYAEGSTIHYGDQTYDAGRVVEFVEATDDGFVYVTERLPAAVVHRRLVRGDEDRPGGPRARRGLSGAHRQSRIAGGMGVCADRRRRSARSWSTTPIDTRSSPHRLGDSLVAVNGDRVYWRRGDDLMRFDQSDGTEEAVSLGSLRADLASNPRMLVIGRPTPTWTPPP